MIYVPVVNNSSYTNIILIIVIELIRHILDIALKICLTQLSRMEAFCLRTPMWFFVVAVFGLCKFD